ncbi:MAG: DUF4294 domain-containing protein [Myroides sp.]|nr:DUF4294 domain-containing protein [uncultured Flavobacterium sp.]MBS7321554.1 DUF4294 domain-containing protein [Myroides sp.]
MKAFIIVLFTIFCWSAQAQVNDWEKYADSLRTNVLDDGEIEKEYMLPELYMNFSKEELERIKIENALRRRILRVYPYAVLTSHNLTNLNAEMAKLSTKKEQRRHLRKTEKYLKEQFEERLKKLSRKDGQILVKLINRQTGQTTFELVKDLKSGWSAFWSNQTAKLFDINLKTKYAPADVLEDFYIEMILQELRDEGRIQYREAARDLNMNKVKSHWKATLGDSGYYPNEN